MADELGEHVAYLELLQAVREHLSLVNTATYIGSKPQNVAGWVATQSVPTLKDFRARLVELAFYIREILQRPMKPAARRVSRERSHKLNRTRTVARCSLRTCAYLAYPLAPWRGVMKVERCRRRRNRQVA